MNSWPSFWWAPQERFGWAGSWCGIDWFSIDCLTTVSILFGGRASRQHYTPETALQLLCSMIYNRLVRSPRSPRSLRSPKSIEWLPIEKRTVSYFVSWVNFTWSNCGRLVGSWRSLGSSLVFTIEGADESSTQVLYRVRSHSQETIVTSVQPSWTALPPAALLFSEEKRVGTIELLVMTLPIWSRPFVPSHQWTTNKIPMTSFSCISSIFQRFSILQIKMDSNPDG